MIRIGDLVYLLFIHWIADFVSQSHYVAKNKSKNICVLSWHCFLYGTIFVLATFNLDFGIWLFLTHFCVDFVTSKLNTYLWQKQKVHWFFVSIGFDQFLHFVTIIYLWNYCN